MTLSVRVALQGGGAKLVTLIAAADALSDLVTENKIVITQLAGTSAGSIVACMLATQKPMDNYRKNTLNAAKELIEHFEKIPSMLPLIWKLYRGTPIFPEDKVREFIRQIFQDDDEMFSSLKIPTKVVVSNVRHREKTVFDSTNSQQRIVEVVTTSSALPLAFRSFRQTDLYVDGGLVSNFPASELIKENPNQDSLMGFSFENAQEPQPENVLQYLGALASTAIESNVKYNAERIKEVGGEVCELPGVYKTLEFAEAITALEPDNYKNVKILTRAKIEATLAQLARRSKALKRSAGESIDTKMHRIHKSLSTSHPYRSVRSSMVVFANSLKSTVDSKSVESDEIVQSVHYRPTVPGNSIFALRLGLATGGSMPLANEKDDISVTGPNGKQVNATCTIVERNKSYYSILILDEPLVLTGNEEIRVVHRTSQPSLMENLLTHKRVAFRSVCKQKQPMDIEDLLVAVPSEIGTVVISDLYEHIPLLQSEGLGYSQDDMDGKWSVGHEMTEAEINENRDTLWPSGFVVKGWRTKNLAPGFFCGALVQRS